MALLNFKEIPEAGTSTGQQDTFELFARELLSAMGFKIIQGPARGADGGKDLIIEETRMGAIGNTQVRWLVSCKHFAHSGRSVRPDDERNVLERVGAAGCSAFLGFYSTLPSSGLSEMLHRQSSLQIGIFDRDEIERHVLASSERRSLIQRYFPQSWANLRSSPAELFSVTQGIDCEYCGKNLLEPPSGVWALWHTRRNYETESGYHYVDIHFACKGDCDRILQTLVKQRNASLGFIYDRWDDIPDMTIPTVFITKVMALVNGLNRGNRYEPETFDKLKRLLLATFPFVSRHLNDEDQEVLSRLQRIPAYLGGMGYDE